MWSRFRVQAWGLITTLPRQSRGPVTQSSGITLRLGTRGSPLALTQARMARQALATAHCFDPEQISIEVIRTSGDRIQYRPLADVGGKGLFTKEIEVARSAGESGSRGPPPVTHTLP